jgi:hypothetical protein
MAKIKPMYLIGAAALAAYIFRDKLFGAKTPDDEVLPQEATAPDATIDTTKTGQTVTQAIATAKQIAQGYQDVKVLIKTPDGQKNILLRKKKRIDKKTARKLRRTKGRKRKSSVSVGPLQSSFRPFAPLDTTTTEYASYAPGYNPALIK